MAPAGTAATADDERAVVAIRDCLLLQCHRRAIADISLYSGCDDGFSANRVLVDRVIDGVAQSWIVMAVAIQIIVRDILLGFEHQEPAVPLD